MIIVLPYIINQLPFSAVRLGKYRLLTCTRRVPSARPVVSVFERFPRTISLDSINIKYNQMYRLNRKRPLMLRFLRDNLDSHIGLFLSISCVFL